ncbi:MAG: ABC transporter ATP-binding protein [Lautropia sp.]
MNKVRVQCRGIHLSYGSTEVLRDLDLDVEPGEFFALLGPSGSGKSTLLRLIAGFAQHQRGALLLDGVDISGRPPWTRDIGMVFQSYALWPHLSVRDNVAFGLVERRLPKAQIDAKVDAALDLVGLSGLASRRPGQLSGGQQQRVALARTIVIEPKVLLLDEPLSNLDKTLRVQMRQELLALQRRLGITTIFVTHDQEEAMTTADRMAVLDRGVVQQVGTPVMLFDEPANAFVATFVGTMNLLPARVVSCDDATVGIVVDEIGRLALPRRRDAAPGTPTHGSAHGDATDVAAGGPATLSFRPGALRVGAPASDAPAIVLEATVIAAEFTGESTRYRVSLGAHALVADQPHRAGAVHHRPGDRISLALDPTQLRLLP